MFAWTELASRALSMKTVLFSYVSFDNAQFETLRIPTPEPETLHLLKTTTLGEVVEHTGQGQRI